MPDITDPLHLRIVAQREELIYRLAKPMSRLAESCRKVWGDREKLNSVMRKNLKRVEYGKFLYALGADKIQISDTIAHKKILKEDYARDRAQRPYLKDLGGNSAFTLSQAYISLRAHRPSITAIQAVFDEQNVHLGYVCADFDIRDLPLTGNIAEEPRIWRQIKGDPAIRGGVFQQTRAESELDRHIDDVIGVVEEIMAAHGVFHVMLHFSSSRAVVWQFDDPYRYHLLDVDSLIDVDTCLAFPRRDYPRNATIPLQRIGDILAGFKRLRYMDETLYLRTGTVNIFNGIIGLTFSCDGSHYLPFDEFLDKGHAFWVANLGKI